MGEFTAKSALLVVIIAIAFQNVYSNEVLPTSFAAYEKVKNSPDFGQLPDPYAVENNPFAQRYIDLINDIIRPNWTVSFQKNCLIFILTS